MSKNGDKTRRDVDDDDDDADDDAVAALVPRSMSRLSSSTNVVGERDVSLGVVANSERDGGEARARRRSTPETMLAALVLLLDVFLSHANVDERRRMSEKAFRSDPSVRFRRDESAEKADDERERDFASTRPRSKTLDRSETVDDREIIGAVVKKPSLSNCSLGDGDRGEASALGKSSARCPHCSKSSSLAQAIVIENLNDRLKTLQEREAQLVEELDSYRYGFNGAMAMLASFLDDFVVFCLKLSHKEPVFAALSKLKASIETLPEYFRRYMSGGIDVAFDKEAQEALIDEDEEEVTPENETVEQVRTRLARMRASKKKFTDKSNRKIVESLRKAKQCQLKLSDCEKKLEKSKCERRLAEDNFKWRIGRLRAELREHRSVLGPESDCNRRVAESMRSLVEYLNEKRREAEAKCNEALSALESLRGSGEDDDSRRLKEEAIRLADERAVALKDVERLTVERDHLRGSLSEAKRTADEMSAELAREKILREQLQEDAKRAEFVRIRCLQQESRAAQLENENAELKAQLEELRNRPPPLPVGRSAPVSEEREREWTFERSPSERPYLSRSARRSLSPGHGHNGVDGEPVTGNGTVSGNVRVVTSRKPTPGSILGDFSKAGGPGNMGRGLVCCKCDTKFSISDIAGYEVHIRDCYKVALNSTS